ncbi:enoyl-CoA hydratase/isomerase family protein [Trujillonella endophytica]|uniref:2-(1,2-epoxy-1,2-dihydrophenyl)acetyl-CoA isomerase n=1 Tax=Trujillonella endophytica TaxID=673521 RepID=A0A1H8Q4A9_9ACTN|nr:enoyl-CoA hydratase-related protein [Trujillella endophytica]SEO49092.1 2-(1,2-epoxy-1,2-dihydrophenyl)acetyl-CoA isomerase [Trujillella endophytica]
MADGPQQLTTGTDELLATLDEGVLTLTLNRPGSRNAYSLALLDALGAALDSADGDERVRVVVVTGAGESFCAGGDVKVMARGESLFGPADDVEARRTRHAGAQRATTVRLAEFAKPTLALVNGPAVGAGLALALACDLRVAAESAVLRTGFTRAGLAGDFGCSWLLTRLVGPARATELLLTSRALTAADARDWGLLTDVVPDAELAERGTDLARALAGISPLALRAVKENVARALTHGLAESADAEVDWHVRLVDTPQHRAAVAALNVRNGR